jgi:predicted nuclease of predicted toxin-antitoxin system
MTRRIYADEDPTEELAERLRGEGHDAITVRQMGHKGRTDPWQLAYAAREQRILITCN